MTALLFKKIVSVEMRSFTQQNSGGELDWSWMLAFLVLWLSVVLGEVFGLTLSWWLGLAVGGGFLLTVYLIIGGLLLVFG